MKCEEVYKAWLSEQTEEMRADHKKDPMMFSNKWMNDWMNEYKVSLRKPNKRYQIKSDDRIERITEYLQNIWLVRKFFIDRVGIDPLIINGDQMPLHRNESSTQKTLNFTGVDTFVKENYMLSRERVTAFTQVGEGHTKSFKPAPWCERTMGSKRLIQAGTYDSYHW